MGSVISAGGNKPSLQLWEKTIAEIDQYEMAEWAKIRPGCLRLAVYWLQMLVCLLEVLIRLPFHGAAFLLAAPCAGLGVLRLRGTVKAWKSDATLEENLRVAKGVLGEGSSYRWPLLPVSQMQHHERWLMMYFSYFPHIIWYNLTHPSMPLFSDGVDISIYRPAKPGTRGSGTGDGCCDCSCCQCCLCCNCCSFCCGGAFSGDPCADCCLGCVHALFVPGQRTFRSSFFALSGFHAFQCGTLCGPCVRPCCYDPCAGGDTDLGTCTLCEVDELRLARWVREAHEGKAKRTAKFFDERPHLLRPDPLMEKVFEGPPDPRVLELLVAASAPAQQGMGPAPASAASQGGAPAATAAAGKASPLLADAR